MTISVIIPVYKAANYILRCLESVVAQECDAFSIECILVDDCSPDKSMDITKGFIDQYKGSVSFCIISNTENQGPSVARNNGLMIAKGDYVFFLDSDDYLAKNSLSSLYKEIDQYGCVIDMVIGNFYDYQIGNYWHDREGPPSLLSNHVDIMQRFLRVELSMVAWNRLIRRQFLFDNHLFFRPGMLHEDELWSYKLYNVVQSIVLIPEVTYLYEKNGDSIMNSSANLISRIEGYQIIVSGMLNSLCNDLYVDRFFWGIYMFMKSEAIIRNEGFSGEIVSKNKQLSRMMRSRSLSDCRLFIFFFLQITIQPPFSWLIRYSWFRKKYYRVRMVFRKLALIFDFVHQ